MNISTRQEQKSEKLDENIFGMENVDLELVIGEMLVSRGLTIATAESCTGGLLAGRLINYPGISSVFMEGIITYSNEAKMKRLNVKQETLEMYGAVSKETAYEMARGMAEAANTNIGISITGIAGPGGGTKDKPVGLVYLGMYINGVVKTRKLNLSGNRQEVREKTVTSALEWIRSEVMNVPE